MKTKIPTLTQPATIPHGFKREVRGLTERLNARFGRPVSVYSRFSKGASK